MKVWHLRLIIFKVSKAAIAMVEMPTPNPPIKRAVMKEYTSVGKPDQTAETKYSAPIQIKVLRRPQREVGKPPTTAPNTVPHSAALIVQPCIAPLSDQTP